MMTTWLSRRSPQKRECEDDYVINPARGIYGAFDGVTPIDEYRDADGHNGAYIASRLMRAYFEKSDAAPEGLREGLIEANRLLAEAMEEAGIDRTLRASLWATCAVLIRVEADRIEYAQIGDCMAAAVYGSGPEARIVVLTEDRVQGVDARAKAKRERDRRLGMAVPDESEFADVMKRIDYNRRCMANAPEGYGVANGMEEMHDYVQSGVVERSGLRKLILVSDGLLLPKQPPEASFRQLEQDGLTAYADRVERMERGLGLRPDDKTAVIVEWENTLNG